MSVLVDRVARVKKVNNYLALSRVRVSALASLSAGLGFILYTGSLQPSVLAALAGVFLLASGASALNQIQEREIDALMERTRDRPLPTGGISIRHALMYCAILLASGMALLMTASVTLPPLLGLLAIVLYNGIYTPLKQRTAWAVLPGGLVGTIPPAIGWSYAGGDIVDPVILSVCAFMYLWQVPHFWLLVMKYSADYRRAGLPTLADKFSLIQIRRMAGSWILSTCVAGLMLPLFVQGHGLQVYGLPAFLLAAASAFMFLGGIKMLKQKTGTMSPGWTSLYMLAVIFMLSLGRII